MGEKILGFYNIIGNEKNKIFLERIINANNIVHSYMFEGIEGIGKSIFAREFAKMILCIGEDKVNCNTCKSCIEFNSSNNPDFIQIEPDGKIIKIEQIRQMQEKILEKPIISNKKVYVIKDADLMTKEAQNCLLKTLEEPPAYIVIILVLSNESKILNTVKSRCMRINFEGINEENLRRYASNNFEDTTGLENIIKNCNGSISRLIEIKENFSEYEQVEILIDKFKKGNILDILGVEDVLYKNKDMIEGILDYMTSIFYKGAVNGNMRFVNAIKEVEIAKQRLKQNSNYDMTMDHLVFRIWEEINENSNRS